MANIITLNPGNKVYDGSSSDGFSNINSNFEELNNKKIEIEGEITDSKVEYKKVVFDTTDSKYKLVTKDVDCQSCVAESIKDMTIYRQYNTNDDITISKSYYDVELKNTYSVMQVKNADGGTSDKYFYVLMKVGQDGNKILEKYIDLQVQYTDNLYLFEYNGFIYFITFTDNALIDGLYADGLLVIKLDKDLGLVDNIFIENVNDYTNRNIIDGNILKTMIRRGNNAKYCITNINLDDLTYNTKESPDYYQAASATAMNDSGITKKGTDYYSIYYTGLFLNITTGILTQKNSSGISYFKGLIKGNNIKKLMGFYNNILFGFDENDNLIFSKKIDAIDGISYASGDGIYYIYYDSDFDEYKIFRKINNSSIFYILTFDNTYTYKYYEKITTLSKTAYIQSVEKQSSGYIITTSCGSPSGADDSTTQTVILQDKFVEGTFSDGTCEYKGSTNAITMSDYTQDIITTNVSLTDYTGTDKKLTLTLTDSTLNNYDTCGSTLN